MTSDIGSSDSFNGEVPGETQMKRRGVRNTHLYKKRKEHDCV